jgi:hypothetical protein
MDIEQVAEIFRRNMTRLVHEAAVRSHLQRPSSPPPSPPTFPRPAGG